MAQIYELIEPAWSDYIATRLENVEELARQYPPNLLYRLRNSGVRCTIIGYGDDLRLRVHVGFSYNLLAFERHLAGIAATDLEECELPQEAVGPIAAGEDDVRQFLGAMPVLVAAQRIQLASV